MAAPRKAVKVRVLPGRWLALGKRTHWPASELELARDEADELIRQGIVQPAAEAYPERRHAEPAVVTATSTPPPTVEELADGTAESPR